MANRRSNQKNTRSLTKTGGKSYGITFPIDLIRILGWKPRQKLTVSAKGKKLIVKDWKK